MINKTFTIIAATLLLFAASIHVNAQVDLRVNSPEGFEPFDPIAATLDSLVTIDNIVRYKNVHTLGNQMRNASLTENIPQFSDVVYTDRINKIPSPIPLVYNKQVKQYIDLYAQKKRGLTERMMGLTNLYFPLYEETLEKEGLPLEFKYLSMVESALNPTAVSPCGATGLWQFMFNTGKLYGLQVNSFIDERRDPYKATAAACKYFENMYAIYHDWLLVIASYNCGPGNVNKAIVRSGGKTNFWDIEKYLPAETRGYVPAFIAVTYIMNYPGEHNLFPVPPAISFFETDTVQVTGRISFSTLSRSLDIPEDILSFLNPIYKKRQTPKEGTYTLRLPANKIVAFVANQSLMQQQEFVLANMPPKVNLPSKYAAIFDPDIEYEYVAKTVKKTHIVKRGETLASIADKYEVDANDIKKLNRMHSTKVIKGQKLFVMTSETQRIAHKKAKVDSTLALNKDTSCKDIPDSNITDSNNNSGQIAGPTLTNALAASDGASIEFSDNKVIYHYVQRGDTLYSIAKNYDGVTIDQLLKLNNMNSGKQLKAGMKIKVKVG